MKHAHLSLLLCAFGSIVCVAAPIDGKWTAQVHIPNTYGTQTQTLTLKSDGETLTGSLDMGVAPGVPGRSGAFDIVDGKITGSDVSFKMRLQGNGNTTTIYAGKVDGDDLKLSATHLDGGPAQEISFIRAK